MAIAPRDDAILHHIAGKDLMLLLQSCREFNRAGGGWRREEEEEGEKTPYN